MPRQKISKRVKRLALMFSLTTVILAVATYAWFVGMQIVNVTAFSVEIAAIDSLQLSLDGQTWGETVSISKETLDEVSYADHTNKWAGRGLIPMSSVGQIDYDSSRLILYEKASFTPTAGGYRLMASRVNNYQKSNGELVEEPDGYVVFDLFIRNSSGTQYIGALNEADEEAIYLTTDSSVTVAADGITNTGIENSVRVAFAQIGRVKGTTYVEAPSGEKAAAAAKITGITCNKNETTGLPEASLDGTGVTGICRTATIWEPNDDKHTQNAINWYNTSCKSKSVTDGVVTYSGSCKTVENNKTYETYAVNSDIFSSDQVDVYDGKDYNGYEGSTKLTAFKTFKDTDKVKTGTERDHFFTLAPNSITKVRVYIYIEGQDIDNYDFASIGGAIEIKFGFTKQRFVESDINYVNPAKAPVITLQGDNPLQVVVNPTGEYTDPGVTGKVFSDSEAGKDDVETAADPEDIVIDDSKLNTRVPGTYTVTYTLTDTKGRTTVATRTVIVVESED